VRCCCARCGRASSSTTRRCGASSTARGADRAPRARIIVPRDADTAIVRIGDQQTTLTNLRKPFWPELGLTKGDLIRYYVEIAPVLLPHVRDRAMVMKRYPDGAAGPFFFMKRTPRPRPRWLQTCSIAHGSGNVIDFPMVQDLLTLVWIINLGCIDLNQWYARCDDVDRPDYLHFDLDPTPGATLAQMVDVAHLVRETLGELRLASYAKTTGSRGIHVYVPIVRGPTQRQVWTFAKALAVELARRHPDLVTAEYRVAARPPRHVIVDYNQNAWGRTLASVYSVRPTPRATVSTPLAWDEVTRDLRMEDYRIDSVPARVQERGDLWKPLLGARRHDIGPLLEPAERWLGGAAGGSTRVAARPAPRVRRRPTTGRASPAGG
jgi:bifunctional non-homologous end joining protein LigD